MQQPEPGTAAAEYWDEHRQVVGPALENALAALLEARPPDALRWLAGRLAPAAADGGVPPKRRRADAAAAGAQAPVPRLTPSNAAEFVKPVRAFVFDCDGVLWRGDTVMDGADAALRRLRALGKELYFVTNNSSKSRAQYCRKFATLGISGVSEDRILSSSFAAATYLQSIGFSGGTAYVVGHEGISAELEKVGVHCIGGEADAHKELLPPEELELDPSVGAVVVGVDRYFSYYKLHYAQLCLRNPSCLFIATNTDAATHFTAGQLWPSAGSMVSAISAASGREPTVVGKPSGVLLDHVRRSLGESAKRSDVCMVGDRLDTDIAFGKGGGLRTVLVLSGVATEAQAQSAEPPHRPDRIAASVAALAPPEEG